MKPLLWILAALCAASGPVFAADGKRAFRFSATSAAEARVWQQAARAKLFELMMGGRTPPRTPLDPRILRVETHGALTLTELTLQTLPDRRAHVWLARPTRPQDRVGAVLAINGHGGSGEEVIRGSGLYWYGQALTKMGYVVIAPDVGQHELQHTNWSLMGERTWDALRCLDYLVTLPEVDPERLGVAGLSLGGETTMYVAALDERVKLACSSGWLTTVANMNNGHCPCFDFPGLEEHFDFADIFACVAPRKLVCELGRLERAPGGFPVEIGRHAFEEVRLAYRAFDSDSNAVLTVHSAGHVFNGRDFWPLAEAVLGRSAAALPDEQAAVAWSRFTDGPESLDGTPYHWLGRTALRLELEVRPEAGDALELGWGGKSDRREAVLSVNGKTVIVQGGGHWGFRWLRVPLPTSADGADRYRIEFSRGQGLPAFLSEVRLTRAGGDPQRPALQQPSYRARCTLLPAEAAALGNEAFPEMRRFWDRSVLPRADRGGEDPERSSIQQAEQNGRLANEAFYRCRRYVGGWLAHADPATGLIPRNLRESRDYWNGRDSAADNYPFMVLTADLTDRFLLAGRMLDILRAETRLTSRVGRLPDDYSFSKQGWRRERPDLDAVIFDGAEYVKDGLLPITEWLGPSPWAERMTGILDDIWERAAIDTPFGRIPTVNFEVCGDLLQAGARVYWFTGERKYLDWTLRLGDYFLLGTNHPTRDLRQLRLIDHGCEVVNGLTELYVAVDRVLPEKKRAYTQPLRELFDCILRKGRNGDGLLYTWFNPQTDEHSADLCDTWGYVLDGFYTLWRIDRIESYRDAVRQALGNLKDKYVGACWADKSADGFADSIEGAINLLNREPVETAADWIDSQTRLMWAIQKSDGIVEGWHGDGNFARTSLMYALWKTQGLSVDPWRPDVSFGAVSRDGVLYAVLSADQAWQGRLRFDRPRHRLLMRLPFDYTRINQFPEWFTVAPASRYEVLLDPERLAHRSSAGATGASRRFERVGAELADGIQISLRAGEPLALVVRPK